MVASRAGVEKASKVCEMSVHRTVSLGLREHGKKHERNERWKKAMSLLLQVVVAHLLCDESDDEGIVFQVRDVPSEGREEEPREARRRSCQEKSYH